MTCKFKINSTKICFVIVNVIQKINILNLCRDVSSQLDDSGEHPEHRIYRKSAIRFSLLQRLRAIVSEEQKRNGKLPTYKQGSKSMGEKIANQDYADPSKFLTSSRNSSQVNLNSVETEEEELDLMGECEKLDLTINESDVLREIEKRLEFVDTGQSELKTSQSCNCSFTDVVVENGVSSSQSTECFYETIMEKKLDDDVDSTVKKRVESFSDKSEDRASRSKAPLKRPNRAPPPVPAKPKGLSSFSRVVEGNKVAIHMSSETVVSKTRDSTNDNTIRTNSKSWVKTMVGRFE